MTIKFSCECRRVFEVSETKVGKQATCPDCGKTLTVPQPVESFRDRRRKEKDRAKKRKKRKPEGPARRLLSYIVWPGLVGGGGGIAYAATARGINMELAVMGITAALIASLSAIERVLPSRDAWHWRDGQVLQNLTHTALGTFLTLYVTAAGMIAVLWPARKFVQHELGLAIWPNHWPLGFQVILMVAVWDFLGYWTHRWSHEWGWLWRVHAMHHNQPRLHAVNAGRVHPLDTIKTELFALPVLLLAGVPINVLVWYLAFFRIIGVLSHTNVNLRLGVLNYVFNTPLVHRYHHSSVRTEEHSNYGQNFMVWDLLFGTYTHPDHAGPPELGADTPVPDSLAGQLLSPILWNRGGRRPEAARASAPLIPAAQSLA